MMLSRPLLAIAMASFGIGTTEFVIMGLLPQVATDLRVSIPAAGLLIGGYALGVTFGSPLVAALMSRLSRKTALLILVAMFTVGNLLCGIAPSYGLLMAARILTALCHGSFFGIGAVVATQLVEPRHRSRAVSIMFSGLTLANVLGVPLGTALGQAYGWRSTFLAIVPIGLLALAAIWLWVPTVANPPGQSLLREFKALGRLAVAFPMMTSMLASTSLFCTLTYVAPLLERVSGVSPHGITIVLLIFGIATMIGNLLGGWLSDWRQLTALLLATSALVFLLVALSSLAYSAIGATAALAAWGLVHFVTASPLQTRVVDGAVGAPNLASVLNQSAFNFGNALGAWIGGRALVAGASYDQLPLLSAGLIGLAFIIVACDGLVSRRKAAGLALAR